MAQTIKKYKLFVASPSDLLDERASIDRVISELNQTYGASKGIILEVLKWEKDSAPAAGKLDVQDIINNDIGRDYDLFIGMLWMKFGTPTLSASSGTEEEFEIAYRRFHDNKDSLQILFYFKTSTPTNLNEINTDQLQKINNFKSKLGPKAILYFEFNMPQEFESFLRIHIPKRIDELEIKCQLVDQKYDIKHDSQVEIFEELGLLDHQDNMTESFENSREALARITESLNWVGKQMTNKSLELEKMKATKPSLGTKEMRSYFQKTALIMNDFATRIEPEIPLYSKNFGEAIYSMSQIINLTPADTNEDVEGAYNAISELLVESISSTKGMINFLNSVSILPRMEKELNKSRQNIEIKVSSLINEMNVSNSIAQELIKQFENKFSLGN